MDFLYFFADLMALTAILYFGLGVAGSGKSSRNLRRPRVGTGAQHVVRFDGSDCF